jgi:predicted nucleic acid-binding protein
VLLVDTNVWVEAADISRPHHQACVEVLRQHRGQLIVTAPVVVEAAWFRRSDCEASWFQVIKKLLTDKRFDR